MRTQDECDAWHNPEMQELYLIKKKQNLHHVALSSCVAGSRFQTERFSRFQVWTEIDLNSSDGLVKS